MAKEHPQTAPVEINFFLYKTSIISAFESSLASIWARLHSRITCLSLLFKLFLSFFLFLLFLNSHGQDRRVTENWANTAFSEWTRISEETSGRPKSSPPYHAPSDLLSSSAEMGSRGGKEFLSAIERPGPRFWRASQSEDRHFERPSFPTLNICRSRKPLLTGRIGEPLAFSGIAVTRFYYEKKLIYLL